MTPRTPKKSAGKSASTKRPAGRNEWERREQVALFRWAAMNAGAHTVLRLLFAVPNGMAARSPITVRKMKAEGLRPGVPDVWLPAARGGYHGLVLELKVPPNNLTPSQREWADQLSHMGYMVVAPCWGFEHARDAIIAYLNRLSGCARSPECYKSDLKRRYGLLR